MGFTIRFLSAFGLFAFAFSLAALFQLSDWHIYMTLREASCGIEHDGFDLEKINLSFAPDVGRELKVRRVLLIGPRLTTGCGLCLSVDV